MTENNSPAAEGTGPKPAKRRSSKSEGVVRGTRLGEQQKRRIATRDVQDATQRPGYTRWSKT
ncbi:hypothetical protein K8R03_03850 [Candidatus Kaiserbacteria bacterium]|nr:hypothetical protein [Candidatus Kaiserbacteria bacterium]